MNFNKDIDLDEFKNSLTDIIKDLETNPEIINDMTPEQVLEVEKHLNPYNATIFGPERYTCVSFTNLKEKYMQKLLMTALIGFSYQMASEYTIEDEDLKTQLDKNDFMDVVENQDKKNTTHLQNLQCQYFNKLKKELVDAKCTELEVENYESSEDEETDLHIKVNEMINDEFADNKVFNNERFLKKKEELVNLQSEEEKEVITRFLNKYFKFDPNEHTTSVFNADNEDPERQTNLDNEFTQAIPPNDTYGRFNYYYDVNYEKLRQAVMHLYNDKPDIEVAINIYD